MTSATRAELPPADFGTRFSAFMIDTALLFAAQWLVFIMMSRQLQAAGMTRIEACGADPAPLCDGPSDLLWVLLIVMLVVSTIGYHAWFEGVHGATPGKKWMGLAVVDDADATPIGLRRGVVRAVVRQAFWLSLLILLDVSPLAIGVGPVLFMAIPMTAIAGVALGAVDPGGRSLHDIATRTLVVRSDTIAARAGDAAPAGDEGDAGDAGDAAPADPVPAGDGAR